MLPKLIGTDFELGNFLEGVSDPAGTGGAAARALLACIDGYPKCRPAWSAVNNLCACGCGAVVQFDPQDVGRKFLTNGGCAYIDLQHLELCSAETVSAFDQVACQHAMLRIAQRAVRAANEAQPQGRRIQAVFNNSDGLGNSYGSHSNFLVTRTAWDQMFCTRLQNLLYLAAFQTSSIVFTGQGKVGSEYGAPASEFQLSQRADFFETLTGPQTTSRRPLVNSRDETLCGQVRNARDAGVTGGMARLHVIFFDATLCHVATLLKFGTMQIVLAMMEADLVSARLLLEDPLAAVRVWSHDPSLRACARMADGRRMTAIDLQWHFFEQARRFVESGRCDGIVPRAPEILGHWERVLSLLGKGDFEALTGDLDWVLKRAVLERVFEQRAHLTWRSPEMKHLDLAYASLDPDGGLFWNYDRAGLVRHLVDDGVIEHFTEHPPDDTRAWTRGNLLRAAGEREVDDVNWDWIRVAARLDGRWQASRTIALANPLAWTRADCAFAFEGDGDLGTVVNRLGDYERRLGDGLSDRGLAVLSS